MTVRLHGGLALLLSLCFTWACSGEFPHQSPFDPDAPAHLQAKAQLTGTVALEGESYQGAVTVALEGDRAYLVETDPAGSFAVKDVQPGTYKLRIGTPYFEGFEERVEFSLGTRIDLGQKTLRAKRTIVSGNAVAERVNENTDSVDRRGGVTVTIERTESVRETTGATNQAEPEVPRTTYTTISDEDGDYTFADVPPGEYKVVATYPGAETQTTGIAARGEPGGVAAKDLVLRPLTGFFEIEGTANGQPSNLYTSTPNVTLKLSGFNAVKMRVGLSADSNVSGCVFGPEEEYAAIREYTLKKQGTNLVCVVYISADGRETDKLFGSIIYDITPPDNEFIRLNNGLAFSDSQQLTVNLNAADTHSGMAAMLVSTDPALAGVNEQPFVSPIVLPVTAADEPATVYARFRDKAGNYSAIVSDSVFVDLSAPEVSLFQVEDTSGLPLTETNQPRGIVRFEASDDSPLEMLVSPRADFAGATWQPYTELFQWDFVLPGNPAGETRALHARLRDAAGHAVDAGSYSFLLDTIAPSSVAMDIAASITNNPIITVNLTPGSAEEIALSSDIAFSSANRFNAVSVTTYTLSSIEGVKYLYARFYDRVGNVSETHADQVQLDLAAPTGETVTINQGHAFTKSQTLSLALNALDGLSGVVSMQISTSDDFSATAEVPFSSSAIFTSDVTDGVATVFARFQDRAGNYSGSASDSIVIDTVPPEISLFQLKDFSGNVLTNSNSAKVVVQLEANDSSSLEMQISNRSDFAGSAWQRYVPEIEWDLPLPSDPTGELRTVYGRVRDAAGNIQNAGAYDVWIDTIAPNGTIDILPEASTSPTVAVEFLYAGATEIEIAPEITFQDGLHFAARSSTTYTFPAGEGSRVLYARFWDTAGNVSVVVADQVHLDTTPPQLPGFTIDEGALTNQATLHLNLSALDADEVQISESQCGGLWLPYAEKYAYDLADITDGLKTIFIRFRDKAGNMTSCLSKEIVLDQTAPLVDVFQARDSSGNIITRTNELRYYLALTVTDASSIQVQFSATSNFSGVPLEPYSGSKAWDVAPPSDPLGEARTTWLRVVDAAGNASIAGPVEVLVDTIEPLSPALTVAPALVSHPTVTIGFSANYADYIELSEDISFLTPDRFAMRASTTYTFVSDVEGTKTVYARYFDLAGNISAIVAGETHLDKTAPSPATFSIAQETLTNKLQLQLELTAGGSSEMEVREWGCSGASWRPYESQFTHPFTDGTEGERVIAVRFRDAAGNQTECLKRTVTLDITPPYFTNGNPIEINAGATATTNRNVSLALAVTDAVEMSISEDPMLADALWRPFNKASAWILSSEYETKTLFGKFRDLAGNTTPIVSDDILLMQARPAVYILDGQYTRYRTVQVQILSNNASEYRVSESPDFTGVPWQPYQLVEPFSLSDTDGTKTLHVQVRDTLGNESAVATASITLDRTVPDVTVFRAVNAYGNEITSTEELRYYFELTATDSSPLTVQYSSSDDFTGVVAETLLPLRPWDVGPVYDTNGETRTTYARVLDAAGNATVLGPIEIWVDPIAQANLGTINIHGSPVSSETVTVDLDAGGAVAVELSEFPDFVIAVSFAMTEITTFTFTPGEGLRYLYARYYDNQGNYGPTATDSTVIDLTPPANAGFVIDGAPATPNLSTMLYSSTTGASLMQVSEHECNGPWVAFDTSYPYTFTNAVNGTKYIAVRYADDAEHRTACIIETILLDTSLPQLHALSSEDWVVGDIVTVTGTNLGTDVGSALLAQSEETVQAPIAGWSDTAVAITVPVGVSPGAVLISTSVNGKVSQSLAATIHPYITGMPSRVVAGEQIAIDGTTFGNAQGTVTIGSLDASVDSWSDTQVHVAIPHGVGGRVQPVVITSQNGTPSPVTTVTVMPHIEYVDPTTGNTSVRIWGSNFGFTQGDSVVTFSGFEASVLSWSNSQVEVEVSPAAPMGDHDLDVVVGELYSNPVTFQIQGPIIANPHRGDAYDTVHLEGKNFGSSSYAGSIQLGDRVVPHTLWNPNQIEFELPDDALGGGYDVTVTFATEFGGYTTSTTFTVYPTFQFHGLAWPGNTISVVGFALGDTPGKLFIAGELIEVNSWANEAIVFEVPVIAAGPATAVVIPDYGEPSEVRSSPIFPWIDTAYPHPATSMDPVRLEGWGFGDVAGQLLYRTYDTWTSPALTPYSQWATDSVQATQADRNYYSVELDSNIRSNYFPVSIWSQNEVVTDFEPAFRTDFSTVWTGKEMIIWGGLVGGIASNTGARYNPATDTWVPMRYLNPPPARYKHTAVWTGGSMIVWGGLDETDMPLTVGRRYHPYSDVWDGTLNVGSPSARYAHSAVWTGKEMIVWGGTDGTTNLDDGGILSYWPDGGWRPISAADAPSGRSEHTALWTGKEMIVWGGWESSFSVSNSGAVYDPKADYWSPITQTGAPSVRTGYSAVWLSDRMVIWGGRPPSTPPSSEYPVPETLQDGAMYSPSTNTWESLPLLNAPSHRYLHSAVVAGDEMIVWGGQEVMKVGEFNCNWLGCEGIFSSSAMNDGARFSPLANSWSAVTTAAAPTARDQHAAVWTGDEMVVWGGRSGPGSSGGRYNPLTDTWEEMRSSEKPPARRGHSAIWTGSEFIIYGGNLNLYGMGVSTGTGFKYNPATDQWLPINSTLTREKHRAVWTGFAMLVWGGWNSNGYLDEGGWYNPVSNSWTSIFGPQSRIHHTAVWSGSEMLIWGGRYGTAYSPVGYSFDPALEVWSETCTYNWLGGTCAAAGPGREGHSAVWTGENLIVWGGVNGASAECAVGGNLLGVGSKYDPADGSWTPITTVTAPTARCGHAAVWTGSRMVVAGGYPTNEVGGSYDPITDSWALLNSTNRNYDPPLVNPAVVWTGDRMFMWGGIELDSWQGWNQKGFTFEPATNTWTQINPAPMPGPDVSAAWTGQEVMMFVNGHLVRYRPTP